jgi:hypothetical protein
MKNVVLAFALLVVACSKSSPPPVEPSTEPPATEMPAAGAPTCSTDADCVVSCSKPNDCCDQLCPPCEQVFNTAGLAELDTWKQGNCAATQCPVAKCMAPREETFARCVSGSCTIERKPVAAAE